MRSKMQTNEERIDVPQAEPHAIAVATARTFGAGILGTVLTNPLDVKHVTEVVNGKGTVRLSNPFACLGSNTLANTIRSAMVYYTMPGMQSGIAASYAAYVPLSNKDIQDQAYIFGSTLEGGMSANYTYFRNARIASGAKTFGEVYRQTPREVLKKGIQNGIALGMLRNATYAITYIACLDFIENNTIHKKKKVGSVDHLSAIHIAENFLSGVIAGIPGATVSTPMSFMQMKMMGNKDLKVTARDVFVETLKEKGIKGFYQGFLARVLPRMALISGVTAVALDTAPAAVNFAFRVYEKFAAVLSATYASMNEESQPQQTIGWAVPYAQKMKTSSSLVPHLNDADAFKSASHALYGKFDKEPNSARPVQHEKHFQMLYGNYSPRLFAKKNGKQSRCPHSEKELRQLTSPVF